MPSNNFSFSLAKRRWDLLAKEGLHRNLFIFDKVSNNNFLLPSYCPDMLTCYDLLAVFLWHLLLLIVAEYYLVQVSNN